MRNIDMQCMLKRRVVSGPNGREKFMLLFFCPALNSFSFLSGIQCNNFVFIHIVK